jgi:hypothetical protein
MLHEGMSVRNDPLFFHQGQPANTDDPKAENISENYFFPKAVDWTGRREAAIYSRCEERVSARVNIEVE